MVFINKKNISYLLSSISMASFIFIPSLRSLFGLPKIVYLPSFIWLLTHVILSREDRKFTKIQLTWWICLMGFFGYMLIISLLKGENDNIYLASLFLGSSIFVGILCSSNWPKMFYVNTIYAVIISGNVISILVIYGHILGGGKFTRIFDDAGYITLGLTTSISYCLSLPLLLKYKNKILIASCIVSGLGIVTVLSRAAIIFSGFISIMLLFLYWPGYHNKKQLYTSITLRITSICCALALAINFLPNRTMNRIKRLFLGDELNSHGRGELWGDAVNQIKDSPFWGKGLGHASVDNIYPHNLFLQIGIDGGIPSMLLLSVIVGYPILLFFIAWRRKLLSKEPFLVSILCAYIWSCLEYSVSGDFYKARPLFILGSMLIGYLALLFSHENSYQGVSN